MDISVNFRLFIASLEPLPEFGAVAAIGEFSFADSKNEQRKKLVRIFYEQAACWKAETQHWSSVSKMLAHPSYLRIVGLARLSAGNEIERLLLQELEAEPDYWFDALIAITGENPVQPEDDFDQSVDAWLEWGRQKGIIAHCER
ncbi:MAG TPA: hypothetical protein VNW97_15110 [Candidatus Saccharimonadales bacterium]|jgi:hypothetical protein|nr:hypothetical protein [Candidatus Saccharimonadales bacterium]